MKITAISDLHGKLPKIRKSDILLIAGDLCPSFNHDIDFQKVWIQDNFLPWCKSIKAEVIFVAGNHDWYFENLYGQGESYGNPFKETLPSNCHYLMDEKIEIKGITVYGTPWQPFFCDWAFNLSEWELDRRFSLIPEDVDIVLSHGPAFGHCDTIMGDQRYDRGHLGSQALYKHIMRVGPKYCITGHIHSGNHEIEEENNVKFACVSLLDERYQVGYKPLIIKDL